MISRPSSVEPSIDPTENPVSRSKQQSVVQHHIDEQHQPPVICKTQQQSVVQQHNDEPQQPSDTLEPSIAPTGSAVSCEIQQSVVQQHIDEQQQLLFSCAFTVFLKLSYTSLNYMPIYA